jgi:60S ribosome subunit biogenesis protein NIP7
MHRLLTRKELTTMKRAFDKWGVFDFFKDKSILVKEIENYNIREVYFLSNEIEKIALLEQPSYAGLMIGQLKKQFSLSIEGADLVSKISKQFPYIIVNETAEKSILYGKNVFSSSIISTSKMIDENEVVIILNSKRETIAVGKTRFADNLLLQDDKVVVTTTIDAGLYLRSEGKIKDKKQME